MSNEKNTNYIPANQNVNEQIVINTRDIGDLKEGFAVLATNVGALASVNLATVKTVKGMSFWQGALIAGGAIAGIGLLIHHRNIRNIKKEQEKIQKEIDHTNTTIIYLESKIADLTAKNRG